MTETKQKEKAPPLKFKKGDKVYLTAFLKQEQGIFYACRGVIEEIPPRRFGVRLYKVQIVSVADRAFGSKKVVDQAQLLGLHCSKAETELSFTLSDFMKPKKWIDFLR